MANRRSSSSAVGRGGGAADRPDEKASRGEILSALSDQARGAASGVASHPAHLRPHSDAGAGGGGGMPGTCAGRSARYGDLLRRILAQTKGKVPASGLPVALVRDLRIE